MNDQNPDQSLLAQLNAMHDAQAALLGQLHALKMGLLALIVTHPSPHAVAQTLFRASERATAALLGTPLPDESIAAYEHTVAWLREVAQRAASGRAAQS